MKTNLKWVNQYLNEPLPLTEQAVLDLANQVEKTSVELESVGNGAHGQSGLVVVRVKTVEDHPDSDHLHIVQVNDGQADIQVVTGAPNVAVGQLVILARVGAKIYNQESQSLQTLAAVKLRGVDSAGMLVALQEIGVPDQVCPHELAAGIHVFAEQDELQPGDDALAALGLLDPIVDTDLTPNRADLLSIRGMAYELAAMTGRKVHWQKQALVESAAATDQVISLTIEHGLATGLAARVVEQKQIGESPRWLQALLMTAGYQPVNRAVDAAHYEMIKSGQPIAAYDLDQLASQELTVRLAREKEVLVQGQEQIELRAGQDMVLAAGDQVVALAGVASDSQLAVTKETKRVLLIAGQYQPTKVRQAARQLNLSSEASFRFERGIDLGMTQPALDDAAALLASLTAGQVLAGQVTAGFDQTLARTIPITTARINQILGTALSDQEVATFFDRLALPYDLADGQFTVHVPSRRNDLAIPADLIEEVGRLYGYDNLPTALIDGQSTAGDLTLRQKKIRASRALLESLGFNQAISYALTTPEKAVRFNLAGSQPVVTLDYPMSSDKTTARQNLLSGLLDDVAYNAARSVATIALYEQGRVFLSRDQDQQPEEREHLAGIYVGQISESTWQAGQKDRPMDFFAMKGRVETYLAEIGVTDVTFEASQSPAAMHPGQNAAIYAGGTYLGYVGQVHPALLAKEKLPTVFAFELDLESILTLAKRDHHYQPVTRYPKITRDLAVLVDAALPEQTVAEKIWAEGGPYLQAVTFFDLYTGQGTAENKKSLAYQLTYQNPADTLVEAEVTADFDQICMALTAAFDAEIR
ncbi:phenylalanine--tRNA ligase subunit beta [Leuconostocaceae bacterium ESL0958]|nr:phenylalanine--tRNA ligase subunit beta [Leuconostocaceae bacterium ESL0958]